MRTYFFISLLLLFSCKSQDHSTIFKNKSYSVQADKITQNNIEASALSSVHISSEYQKELVTKFDFKFSVNGFNNESEASRYHTIEFSNSLDSIETEIFVFGKKFKTSEPFTAKTNSVNNSTLVTFRLDMRHVIDSFNTKGYYTFYENQKITKEQFKNVSVVGGHNLLNNWDYASAANNINLILQDNDNDGIYTTTVEFPLQHEWKLTKDISMFPQYQSPYLLSDALYNMSLEEVLLNIRPDSAFMAGEQWGGVWTRDISNSIILSLASIAPEISQKSLMHKTRYGRIIQDTGTGGSWPVSTDRVIWASAAWQIYCATGSKSWLDTAFYIIKNSLDADRKIALASNGLFNGETASMDWREQSYPRWMDARDIFHSQAVVTNCVHYEAYQSLIKMGREKGINMEEYIQFATNLKDAINKHFWMPSKGYYGGYIYGRSYPALSPRMEAMGEAWSILTGIANTERQKSIIENVPVLDWGISDFYPQIPNMPPYHNDAVWPFIEAYWMLAAAKTGNEQAVKHIIGSIYRLSALNLTNKENFVAGNGHSFGTSINSSRQLWSVAANLSIVYKLFFGMEFYADRLEFKPFVPESLKGKRTLSAFPYRGSVLDISLTGFGTEIASVKLDGKKVDKAQISASMKGRHVLEIELANKPFPSEKMNLVQNYYSPETPEVKFSNNKLAWPAAQKAVKYLIYKNGKKTGETAGLNFEIEPSQTGLTEYQVSAVDKNGVPSFLSNPVELVSEIIKLEAEAPYKHLTANTLREYSGSGYIFLSKTENTSLEYSISTQLGGEYLFGCRYVNPGDYFSGNQCAVRSVYLDGNYAGSLVMPICLNGKEDWRPSSNLVLKLSPGHHTLKICFDPFNNNMNFEENQASIDFFELKKLKQ